MKYRSDLARLAEGNGEYAEFNRRIANTKKVVLGVRMPALRKMAREVARGMDVEAVRVLISETDTDVYEEVLLAGLVIDYAKLTDAETVALLKEWLPSTDSWAHIDTVISKRKKFDRKTWWEFVDWCLRSGEEYVVRCGVVFLMSNYLDELPEVFARLREVRHEGYYVKMAMAWLYAEAATVDWEMTMTEMRSEGIDAWTRRKALQKMVESYRIDEGRKREIRELRKGMK